MNTLTDPAGQTRAQLLTIVRSHCKFAEAETAIEDDSKLADLGLDSMASINLLVDLEDRLGIQIADELIDVDSFETFGNLVELIGRAQA